MIRILPFLLLFTASVFAQNGVFDDSFGVSGHLEFSVGDQNTRGVKMLLLPDQSIILTGNTDQSLFGALINRSLFVSRHTPDGQPDPNFGNNGTLVIENGPNGDTILFDAQIQNDGRIIISAKINGAHALVRISADGIFDGSFGTNGIAVTGSSGKLIVGPDGKITVVDLYYDGYDSIYRFARFHANGTADLNFGTNGVQTQDITSYRFDLPLAVKMHDDKIVVAGSSYDFADQQHAVISRFNANGTPDATFGNYGTVITPFGAAPGFGLFSDIALAGDQILAAGVMEFNGGTGGFMGSKRVMARFDQYGDLDPSFGYDGKIILDALYNGNDHFFGVTVQPDGKILGIGTAGHPYPNPQSHLVITRLNPNATPDLTFGVAGTLTTDNDGAETNGARQIEMLPDGKLLCMGYTRSASGEHLNVLLCRIKPDAPLSLNLYEEPRIPSVYPNPARDLVTISGLGTVKNASKYDVLGRRFATPIIASSNDQTLLDLSGTASGTYFLHLETTSGLQIFKIVIE